MAEALLDLKALQEVGVNLVIVVAGNEGEASGVADRAMDMEIKFALLEVLDGLESGTEYVTDGAFLIRADIDKSGASHDH